MNESNENLATVPMKFSSVWYYTAHIGTAKFKNALEHSCITLVFTFNPGYSSSVNTPNLDCPRGDLIKGVYCT